MLGRMKPEGVSGADALRIRKLTVDDLGFAQELRAIAGWNQTEKDWRRYLAHEPEGCFAAEWNGRPVGTVTTTRHGADLAWIGMMLVHPDFRRRGIATALMRRAMEYLRGQGVPCIKLDATPEGEPVYARLGFQAEWRLRRWEFVFPENETLPDARGNGSTADYAALDRRAFGADRSGWLRRLEAGARQVVCAGEGYGMIRNGARANYLGPIVCASPAATADIVRRLLPHASGRVYWDIPSDNQAAVQLARELGFEPTRDLLRMWTGDRNLPGEPALQYAIGDPSTG